MKSLKHGGTEITEMVSADQLRELCASVFRIYPAICFGTASSLMMRTYQVVFFIEFNFVLFVTSWFDSLFNRTLPICWFAFDQFSLAAAESHRNHDPNRSNWQHQPGNKTGASKHAAGCSKQTA